MEHDIECLELFDESIFLPWITVNVLHLLPVKRFSKKYIRHFPTQFAGNKVKNEPKSASIKETRNKTAKLSFHFIACVES